MKMSKELFDEISDAVEPWIIEIQNARPGRLLAGHSLERFRWDVFWAVDRKAGGELSRKCYGLGLNDTHINTALKHIIDVL